MSIDWASMTTEEINTEITAATAEVSKRHTLDSIPEQMNTLNTTYLVTEGVEVGEAWRQPVGAHDAYPLSWQVAHNDKEWVSTVAGNVWEPGVTGWRESLPEGEYAAWVQPTGAHDVYNQGEMVHHNDRLWSSDVNGNSWEPGVTNTPWSDVGPYPPGEPVDPPVDPPESEILEWEQPTGAHDAYNTGDQVTYSGNLWTSLVDANTWAPPTQWNDEGPYSS